MYVYVLKKAIFAIFSSLYPKLVQNAMVYNPTDWPSQSGVWRFVQMLSLLSVYNWPFTRMLSTDCQSVYSMIPKVVFDGMLSLLTGTGECLVYI